MLLIFFLVPENSGSPFYSEGEFQKNLKNKVMSSYNADQEDEITVKKDDIVDVVTAELSESESLKQDPPKLRGNSSNI